jgi:hypothetical protein
LPEGETGRYFLMNSLLGGQTLVHFFHQHWLSAFFLLLTLFTLLILLTARWWLRRRWKKLLEGEYKDEANLDALPPSSEEDERALDLIKDFRREVWHLSDSELQLSIEALGQRAVHIVTSIAAIYHPAAVDPQYEASLTELLQLVRRVSARLTRMGAIVPLKYLGNRKLSDYQRYYQIYRRFNDHPVTQLLKRNPHLYRVARWALNLKNLANPLYWAGKEISRESYFYLLRWFYLAFVSQVGREAIRVYSGRRFQTEEEREAAVTCYRLFALAKEWGGPTSLEWPVLVGFVTNHPGMELEVKLQVLSAWSNDRLPGNLQEQKLYTKRGLKGYHEALKSLQQTDHEGSSVKKELLRSELETME